MALMGWCRDFGVQVDPACTHAMAAGSTSCSCPECGSVCAGPFGPGCEEVWQGRPRSNGAVRLSAPTLDGERDSRLDRLESTLDRLGDQLEAQGSRYEAQRRDLADLGKVLAQHGLEIDDRLALFEATIEELMGTAPMNAASAGEGRRPGREPAPPA